MNITTTIEGRERYPVNMRYARELRDTVETLKRVLAPLGGIGASSGGISSPAQGTEARGLLSTSSRPFLVSVPLSQLAEI